MSSLRGRIPQAGTLLFPPQAYASEWAKKTGKKSLLEK